MLYMSHKKKLQQSPIHNKFFSVYVGAQIPPYNAYAMLFMLVYTNTHALYWLLWHAYHRLLHCMPCHAMPTKCMYAYTTYLCTQVSTQQITFPCMASHTNLIVRNSLSLSLSYSFPLSFLENFLIFIFSPEGKWGNFFFTSDLYSHFEVHDFRTQKKLGKLHKNFILKNLEKFKFKTKNQSLKKGTGRYWK